MSNLYLVECQCFQHGVPQQRYCHPLDSNTHLQASHGDVHLGIHELSA